MSYVLTLISAFTTVGVTATFDPCYNYTVLNDYWRSTNYTDTSNSYCDTSISWSGWYRLFLQGWSTKMPDTCVDMWRCRGAIPMWLSGGHPTLLEGNVTRSICGHWQSGCCEFSFPIQVKACSGNYYVYQFVQPNSCQSAYCADANSSSSIFLTTAAPPTTTAVVNITLPDGCGSTGNCITNLFQQIDNITALELSPVVVSQVLDLLLNVALNTSDQTPGSSSSSAAQLVSSGNLVLEASEKMVSALVKPTETSDNISLTLPTVELEVFMVGQKVTLDKIPQLDTANASMDIDLIGIAKNNPISNSATVAFISYNSLEKLLKPQFFNNSNDTVKTMMSTVISATLPKTSNKQLTKPVNFTLRHIRDVQPNSSLTCVYWNSGWIEDGCSVLSTNSSHTVCSCVHLSTFALIMETEPAETDSQMDLVDLVCVSVGLVFLTLALLSFALCRWGPGVNNVARINLCLSLLLAQLLYLLTQQFLTLIRPQQMLCAVIAGVLHFLFLSCFVWMLTEAILLFICVKNLSRISSKQREVLSCGFLFVIGYMFALAIVGVSVGLMPEGYSSTSCWIETNLIWSFLGPVCVILTINMILFICIIINLYWSLSRLNSEVTQMNQTRIVVFKTLVQFVILGGSWILGFFSQDSPIVNILFLILSSQQGTFIFLVHCVMNREIRHQYLRLFGVKV